jgi:hypothetical protein
MKRIAILLIFALTVTLPARADETTRRAKAKEMMALLHLDRLMKQMMDATMAQVNTVSKQMAARSATPDAQAKIDKFQQKVLDLMQSQMQWKDLEPIYVDLYAKAFTDEELDGIIAFYKSPAGVSMLEKMPQLTAEAQKIGQERMRAVQPQLEQLMQDFQKDLAAPPDSK